MGFYRSTSFEIFNLSMLIFGGYSLGIDVFIKTFYYKSDLIGIIRRYRIDDI